MRCHSLDRTSLKEFGAVLEPATQTPILIDEFEQQVGPRDTRVRIDRAEGQSMEGRADRRSLLQNKHHPKQRIAIQAAGHTECLQNFFDRQFLVSIRIQRHLPNTP